MLSFIQIPYTLILLRFYKRAEMGEKVHSRVKYLTLKNILKADTILVKMCAFISY